MSQNNFRKWIINTFWLSLLLHALLFLSFSFIFLNYSPPEKKNPHYYVPSYVYTTPSISANAATKAPDIPQHKTEPKPDEKIEKKSDLKTKSSPRSMIASSLNWLQQNQSNAMLSRKNSDPILLVGDKNESPDPLTKAIAKSLSAHFKYPREEGMWGIHGRAIVEMTLHPDGTFTDVNIVQSSENHNLDMAALYAVNSAPRVEGAGKYLSAPKHLVVGFGFYLRRE